MWSVIWAMNVSGICTVRYQRCDDLRAAVYLKERALKAGRNDFLLKMILTYTRCVVICGCKIYCTFFALVKQPVRV